MNTRSGNQVAAVQIYKILKYSTYKALSTHKKLTLLTQAKVQLQRQMQQLNSERRPEQMPLLQEDCTGQLEVLRQRKAELQAKFQRDRLRLEEDVSVSQLSELRERVNKLKEIQQALEMENDQKQLMLLQQERMCGDLKDCQVDLQFVCSAIERAKQRRRQVLSQISECESRISQIHRKTTNKLKTFNGQVNRAQRLSKLKEPSLEVLLMGRRIKKK